MSAQIIPFATHPVTQRRNAAINPFLPMQTIATFWLTLFAGMAAMALLERP
jgi:hypothetical protein